VRTDASIEVEQWAHVAMSYDGSIDAQGVKLYINGHRQEVSIEYNRLTKSIKPVNNWDHKFGHRNLRVGKSNRAYTGEYGIYEGLIDETMLVEHQVQRQQSDKITSQYIKEKRDQWLAISNEVKEIMVMEEMSTPRSTYVYDRGEYQNPTYTVTPNTPAILGPYSAKLSKNRLGLSQWIFGESNPLTARVTVNRYWQMIWGKGIVTTPGDFGIQGSLPTHPELLDWLALDFKEHGWDIKRLIKQMVMSRTYRSSSEVNQEILDKDPDNVLLARAPSYRLPAEMIRDNALAASGLLVQDEIGGASVKPYQPEGLWIEKTSFSHELKRYVPNHGDSLYRRSMYTFIRRTQPHPAMAIFDQPNREICTVKRENTNTPLQALVLLNDPQFVESAKILAQRMQIEGGSDLHEQLIYAFRLVTGRVPVDEELAIFHRLYSDQLTIYALTVVASTMINHDEAYTKR